MCRSIRPLHNYDPPTTAEEVDEAALQYVRKISGMRQPARDNQEAFDRAVEAVADASTACSRSWSPTARRAAAPGRSRRPASAPPSASPPRRPDGWSSASLGRSGLTVPVVGMGTWQTFDVRGDEAERSVRGVVDAAIAGGDDALRQLADVRPGRARARRGPRRAARRRPRRDQGVDATTTPRPTRRWRSRARLATAGTIDLYQVHNLVAAPRRLATLERLRDDGQGGRDRRNALAGEPLRRPRGGHAQWPHRRDPGALQPRRARGRKAGPAARGRARDRRGAHAAVREGRAPRATAGTRRAAARSSRSASRPGPRRCSSGS